MKIAVISQPIQATLVAALNCHRAEVVKQGNAEYLAQLDQAMKVVEVSSTGPEIAQAASQLGIPFTDFVNHGYGVGRENCFVEVAPDMARRACGRGDVPSRCELRCGKVRPGSEASDGLISGQAV